MNLDTSTLAKLRAHVPQAPDESDGDWLRRALRIVLAATERTRLFGPSEVEDARLLIQRSTRGVLRNALDDLCVLYAQQNWPSLSEASRDFVDLIDREEQYILEQLRKLRVYAAAVSAACDADQPDKDSNES